jgi:hypothetical protein
VSPRTIAAEKFVPYPDNSVDEQWGRGAVAKEQMTTSLPSN